MDHFAKALQAALQQRSELWPAAVGEAFDAADIDRVLPLEQALQSEVGSCLDRHPAVPCVHGLSGRMAMCAVVHACIRHHRCWRTPPAQDFQAILEMP